MTNSTDKAKSTGQTVPSTKEITNSERRMVLVSSCGLTNHPTVGTLLTTTSMGMVDIDGLMAVNIAEIGFATKCTDPVSSLGQMDENTTANTSTTKSKVTEFSRGQTADNMMVHG
jgi:hypothetical protein